MSLAPLGWPASLLLFGVPCLVVTGFLFVVLPWAAASGASPLATFHAGFVAPLALLLMATFVAYRMEGRPWTWAAVRDRFRLQRPDRATWLWTLGLVGWLALWMPFLPLNGWVQSAFAGVSFYDQPSGYTAFMNGLTDGQTHIFGQPFTWGLLLYFLVGLFVFNILGEELWWRGYILPRQELAFGRKTWVLHGVLWTLFHAFYHTTLGILVSYLPTTLAISYVAQRTRNTWPGIVGHMVANLGIPLLMLSRLLAL
jgi:membrane protease YdiL (CAAX protease family)